MTPDEFKNGAYPQRGAEPVQAQPQQDAIVLAFSAAAVDLLCLERQEHDFSTALIRYLRYSRQGVLPAGVLPAGVSEVTVFALQQPTPQPVQAQQPATDADALAYIASRAHAAMARLGDPEFVRKAINDIRERCGGEPV